MLGDYPLTKSIEECYKTISANPFSRDFDIQAEAAVKLYGSYFKFGTGKKSLLNCSKQVCEEYLENSVRKDAKEITERVDEVLRMQIRKYGFYLKRS